MINTFLFNEIVARSFGNRRELGFFGFKSTIITRTVHVFGKYSVNRKLMVRFRLPDRDLCTVCKLNVNLSSGLEDSTGIGQDPI
jgi:hypothetical protein